MADKKKYTPTAPRSELRIILERGGKRETQERLFPAITGEVFGPGVGRLPDDEIVRVSKPKLHLYDLGTRLRTRDDIATMTPPDSIAVLDISRQRLRTDTDTPPAPDADNHLPGYAHEYVEIAIDGLGNDLTLLDPDNVANSFNRGVNADLTLEMQRGFDDTLLGSRLRRHDNPAWRPADPLDPFGFSKAIGSGRRLSNCSPIPFDTLQYDTSTGLYFDARILVDIILARGSEPDTVLVAAQYKRASARQIGDPRAAMIDSVRWKERIQDADKDPLEPWSWLNVAEGTSGIHAGYFDTKGLGAGYDLRVDSRLWYEPFDTGDTVNFKVTRDPFFEGAEVPFKFSANRETHIYLKPQYLIGSVLFFWTSLGYRYKFETSYYLDYEYPGSSVQSYWRHLQATLVGVANLVSLTSTAVKADPTSLVVGLSIDLIHHLADPDNVAYINGTLAVSGTTYESLIPGLWVGVITHPTGSPWTGSASYITEWHYVQFTYTLKLSATMLAGPFAFRLPYYGQFESGIWASVYDYMGNNPIYGDLDGRQLTFGQSGPTTKKRAFFTRNADWSEQMYARELTHARLQYADLIDCQGHTAQPLVITPYPDFSLWDTWRDTERDDVVTCAVAMPYTRAGLVFLNTTDEEQADFSGFRAYPAKTLPAGALVGVINNGGVYYVWRKMALNRESADYNRDNLGGSI